MGGKRVLFLCAIVVVIAFAAPAVASAATWYGPVVGYTPLQVTARQAIIYSTYYDGTFNYVKPYQTVGEWWCRDYVSNNQYVRGSVPFSYMYLQLTGMRPNKTWYWGTKFSSGKKTTTRSYYDYRTTLYKSSWSTGADYVSIDSMEATGSFAWIDAWSTGYLYNAYGGYTTTLTPKCYKSFY